MCSPSAIPSLYTQRRVGGPSRHPDSIPSQLAVCRLALRTKRAHTYTTKHRAVLRIISSHRPETRHLLLNLLHHIPSDSARMDFDKSFSNFDATALSRSNAANMPQRACLSQLPPAARDTIPDSPRSTPLHVAPANTLCVASAGECHVRPRLGVDRQRTSLPVSF
ncbi:hypothetical protein CMUS01_11573 [Colletotrichum musicola]|uniref:Uncharacterized protein n=1 Tax=Colletotrichum musicola TaxID=2175873 RepID=A0A8H6N5K1_9PEZI|nr:hypothetical protein CMUS01_11573 [Colletotrichum musicola]